MTDKELKISIITSVIARISKGINNFMCLAVLNVIQTEENCIYFKHSIHSNKIYADIVTDLTKFKPTPPDVADWFPEAIAGSPAGKKVRLKILKTILKQYQNGE